jgi:hypothetical protein
MPGGIGEEDNPYAIVDIPVVNSRRRRSSLNHRFFVPFKVIDAEDHLNHIFVVSFTQLIVLLTQPDSQT